MSAPSVSFEIFPPASMTASFKLWDAMARLSTFAPDYVSVTYGAQGSAQDKTLDTARAVMEQTKLPVASHLTAARASKEDVMTRAQGFADAGIRDIVALRGDPDSAGAEFAPHPDGFASSVELVSALAETGNFNIRVGAYPESHPSASSQQQNIDYLKAKFDAGASEAITQFFFEADTFLRFRDACAKAGITQRIVPGILPPTNWTRARSFAERCGASVPDWLDQAFDAAIRDDRADLLSLAVTTELCSTLIDEGVDHLHIYTLNSAHLTERLCLALGLAPEQPVLRPVLRDVA
ncbi:5,10-methylenetetrahydrofolate reductase [Aliishimia ponticola]|uniref:Methylenetetrahydrofolate reductase n=1 Tax=Aliishimia ponticola TaxID=2499833 RepID=A0A4S4NGS9_9RHOB|nr:methylenetetrahydrofolate reductase [Aliishimia ponticola]THH37361.1 5,10-methylenetetrahydrofolate reductase [Aliishimia ponticola]